MPDPSPKRIDPPRSSVPDGAINDITRWANLDHGRVYCEANPNDADTGVAECRRLGWRPEEIRKDGPRLLGGDAASDGALCTRNGMILMSRPRDAQAAYEVEKFGVADTRSKSIGRHGGVDPVAGIYGQAHNTANSNEQVVRG